jgi:hypothetical protein
MALLCNFRRRLGELFGLLIRFSSRQ